jgi:hypothetical protein
MGISSTSQTAPVQHPPPWTPRSNRAPSFARCGEPSAPRVKKGKRSLGRESLAGRQGNPLRPEEDRPRWVGPDIECLSNMRLSSHLLQQGRFNMPGIHGTCPSSMEAWIEVQYSMSLDTHRLRKPPNAPSMPPSREICASRTRIQRILGSVIERPCGILIGGNTAPKGSVLSALPSLLYLEVRGRGTVSSPLSLGRSPASARPSLEWCE